MHSSLWRSIMSPTIEESICGATIEEGALKRIMLKRFVVLAGVLAMALAFTVPVIADEVSQNVTDQVSQSTDREVDSGDVGQTSEVTDSGSSANQCVGGSGVTNTGNLQPATDLLQFNSVANDFQFEDGGSANVLQVDAVAGDFAFDGGGPQLAVDGSGTTSCGQQGNQAATTG